MRKPKYKSGDLVELIFDGESDGFHRIEDSFVKNEEEVTYTLQTINGVFSEDDLHLKDVERMKKEQWFRTKKGGIYQYDGTCVSDYNRKDKLFYLTANDYNEIIKVANTPQELVQDKDLIQYTLTLNGNTWETLIMECDDFEEELYQLEEEFENVEITKILTPNSNGGYDLQYEKENSYE